jgi:hypothetical protein
MPDESLIFRSRKWAEVLGGHKRNSLRIIGNPYLTALSDRILYGTAEAVPFVQPAFPF